MSSSAHSALASLTANYTDSEPEEEEEDVSEPQEEIHKNSESLAAAMSISPDPDEESNSRDAHSASSHGDSGSGSRTGTKGNPLGLVSYIDDIVDDDMDIIDADSDSTRDKDTAAGTDEDGDVIIHPQNSSAILVGDTSKNDKPGVSDLEDISQDKDLSTEATEKKRPPTKKSILLPPEPPGKCSDELQKRFTHLLDRKIKENFNMNAVIQKKKQFRNPSIYEKLILQCNIEEHGTNYPKHIFDPYQWDESSFYDELAKAQKTEMERREKERKERTKVEFVSGTVKKIAPVTSGSHAESEPKRKSKWDQKGVMPMFGTAAVTAPTIQPVLVQPPFTANTSGTKGTVINAFGSLPKKPKL